MAKTTAPLLSFGADGQIGKSMVMSKWRGISYARRYVVPANPNTLAQQAVRSRFALLREMWKISPVGQQAPWDTFALGRPFLGLNKFVGENLRVLNGESDFANFIGSPGARGGLAPSLMTASTGSGTGEVDVAFTAPTAPSGWTLTAAQAVAFADQDPAGFFSGQFVYAEDTSAPYDGIVFTDFAAGVDVVVSGWLEWEKPNGDVAFSPSLTDIVAAGA